MDFGLGLILSFTDNATSGINNAVNSLNQLTQTAESASTSLNQMASLSALSVVSGQLGNAFTSAGQAIISTLGAVISKVNETGQTLMYAESQLGKLYEGSGKTGKDVLNDISAYAKASIFDFEDLIPVVTMLKANGIEAFDMIASSTGNANQTLMDYAADLAAFNPQMRNAYGTGIQAAMGALNEYIAEGNARSLKAGASLDITALLGEDKGATIEERSRQVADLMEQLNMVGMTAQLAQSPMTKLSNMGDTLFQFLGMISNSGVYDQFNALVSKFADYVLAIPDDELEALAKSIGEALSSLLRPLEKVIDYLLKFCDGVRTLLKENPRLAKFGIIIAGIAGVLFVFLGTVLKVTSALSGVSLMFLAFGNSFNTIGGMFKTGMLKILSTLLPLTLAIGVMYGIWKSDLGGIRTMITSFVDNLVNSFQLAKTSVSGSLSEMQQVLKTFDTQNSFFDGLTLAIMRLMVLGRALVEGWNNYTLSEDTFLKAKELGILPLIEAIFDFLYRFRLFKEGFIEGWKEVSEKVKEFVLGLLENIDGTVFDSLLDGVTSFIQKLSENDPEAWKEFGRIVGEIAVKAVIMFAAFKAFDWVIGKVAKVVSVFVGLVKAVSGIGKIFSTIGKLLAKVFPHISKLITGFKGIIEVIQLVAGGAGTLHEAMVAVFGTVGTVVAGVASIITGAVMAVVNFFDMLKNGFSWLKEILMVIGIALAAVGAVILGAPALIAAIVAGIVAAIATAIVVIKEHWEEIKAWFLGLCETIGNFFSNLWNGIKNGVSAVVNAIKTFFSTIASWIYNNVIAPVVGFFMTYIYPFIEKIVEIVAKIIEIIVVLVGVFVDWINTNVIQPIINFFVGLWNTIVEGVTSFVESVKGVIFTIVDWISTNIITPISEFFSGLWNTIVEGVTSFIEGVKNVFLTIVEWISTNIITPIANFFQGLWEKIQTAFNTVAETVSSVFKSVVNAVFSFIGGIINGVIRGINTAIGVINAIPGVNISKIEELNIPQMAQGGVVDKPTMALVGEAGKEVVMPLENNTGWIGELAYMLSNHLQSVSTQPESGGTQLTPVSNQVNNSSTVSGDTSNSYLTTNNNTTQQVAGDTDNSVTFEAGAIQIQVQQATQEEAMRLAQMVMMYIQRQQELKTMMNYG